MGGEGGWGLGKYLAKVEGDEPMNFLLDSQSFIVGDERLSRSYLPIASLNKWVEVISRWIPFIAHVSFCNFISRQYYSKDWWEKVEFMCAVRAIINVSW